MGAVNGPGEGSHAAVQVSKTMEQSDLERARQIEEARASRTTRWVLIGFFVVFALYVGIKAYQISTALKVWDGQSIEIPSDRKLMPAK